MDTPPNALYAFTGAFIDELVRAGVAHVCVCPGSRSTPLALACAGRPDLRPWIHLDERSAAFFALGMAKESGMPVALIGTSGTAIANFMPAVVEARHAQVPLLVLTADRPPELRDSGAAQTIDQLRFYGVQVKWCVEMPLPEASGDLLRFVRMTAARAVATARTPAPGPVHLNFPFREPLTPIPANLPPLAPPALHGRPDRVPYARAVPSPGPAPDERMVQRLADDAGRAGRGLIVCGPMEQGAPLAERIAELADTLGYPILADPLSGLRCGPHDRSLVIDAHDAFLRDDAVAASLAPEMVLRFGAPPTAKSLLQYLQRHADVPQILVGAEIWRDPAHLVAEVVHASPDLFCAALSAHLRPAADRRWAARWQETNRRAREAIARELDTLDELCEARAMAELAELLPDGAALMAGNSMPVRDIDTFFPATGRAIRLFGNRGASGIDGVTSTALGIAALHAGPVVLAIGDISFYHDLNGLLAAKRHGLNLTIVLLNNDGGGIFSFLPQAELPRDAHGDPFELLFGTPHGLDFAHAAALYGAIYTRVQTWPQYRTAVVRGLHEGGLHIVEVPGNRARNVALHRRIWPAVAAAVAEVAR